jgi:hypothetical protein
VPQDERESALTDGTEPDEDQPAVELYVFPLVHFEKIIFYVLKSSIFPRAQRNIFRPTEFQCPRRRENAARFASARNRDTTAASRAGEMARGSVGK